MDTMADTQDSETALAIEKTSGQEVNTIADRAVKILSFTTLYPNAAQPRHGVFVENRIRRIAQQENVDLRVVAPVPLFPLRNSVFGRYALYANVPASEQRHGVDVLHPRFPVVPKVGMTLSPYLLYRWMRPVMSQLMADGYDFDLIDAHYFYPDGVAAALLGRWLNRPVVITARGSDINVIARHALPGSFIRWAARQAAGVIAVSNGLADEMAARGLDRQRIRVLRNGVDLDLFRPLDRQACRREMGLEGPVLLSVGNLVALKGHDLVIKALHNLPGFQLVIVGTGPEEGTLRALSETQGLSDRIRFHGGVAHEELATIYNAADALVLASASEGWPNVLLEAIACGTPVISSDVSGARDAVSAPAAGLICRERTPEAIVAAVNSLLAKRPSREETRRHAEHFDWDETIEQQVALYRNVVGSQV